MTVQQHTHTHSGGSGSALAPVSTKKAGSNHKLMDFERRIVSFIIDRVQFRVGSSNLCKVKVD